MAPPIEEFDIPDPIENYLRSVFEGTEFRRLKGRTDRACLKVAPLGDGVGTQIIYRWDLLDSYPQRDALHCDEEECRDIREKLVTQLVMCEDAQETLTDGLETAVESVLGRVPTEPLQCPQTGENILLSDIKDALNQTSDLGRDEIPIGFLNPPIKGGTFEYDNISWLKPPNDLFTLREFFEEYSTMQEKVQRKSYKTDRRLTGRYKTNREHRWEAHPSDPQAASKYQCWGIEFKLLAQILRFDGAPSIPDGIEDEVRNAVGRRLEYDSTILLKNSL